MKKNQDPPADAAELRRRAEERLKRQRPAGGGQRTELETTRLVHELQVHQIELEMQNEEIKTSRTEMVAGLALYADLYDFAPTGYLTFDREGVIRLVNLTGARLLGVERSRLVKRRFGQFVAESDRRAFSDFLQKVFASQAKECCVVTLLQEGSQPLIVWIEGTRSADEQECCVVVLDITARKRAEEKMRRLHIELEQSNHDLQRRTQEIQTFYHTLSHELKTPLTSAREFVSIVMDGLAGPLNETQLEYLGIAKESCDQLRLYVNDLLDVTRLETGKMSLEFQTAPLATLVERVVEMLAPAAAGKEVRLSCDCQPDLPAIPLDHQRILQVLTNLTTNAIKFTPAGGQIRLSLSESPASPECLQVAVRDTGRGIPKDQLNLIFSRLYQVNGDDRFVESRSGLGLGLYICQELVQLHGGRIRVESEPGQGSTFTFTIPKRQAPATLNVLVVDDETTIRDTLRQLLEKKGYQVTLAGGGAEALGLMRQQLPALVILDLQMPDMDGVETLVQIRKQWGAIPVIIHTAYTEGDLMNRALNGAPFTVLAKPAPPEQILNMVRTLARWNHESRAGQKL